MSHYELLQETSQSTPTISQRRFHPDPGKENKASGYIFQVFMVGTVHSEVFWVENMQSCRCVPTFWQSMLSPSLEPTYGDKCDPIIPAG